MPSDPKQTKKAYMQHLWSWKGSVSPDTEYEIVHGELPKEGVLEELSDIVDMTGNSQPPGSKEEWRIAVALQRYDIPFYYQYSIDGGRRVRGGQVIDFYTPDTLPAWLIYAQGEYWHGRETERQLNIARAEQYFGGYAKVLEIWDYEHSTLEETIRLIKEKVL
jgi:hypothetical protein